jgi:formylglycine-generating enzyme required for sulfatase activity
VQWEWAAGGQRDKPDKVLKVRDYPWPEEKGKPDKSRANYNNHEGGTIPVGRYPEGATPEGLYDMAGNVWEWMEDIYKKEENWKALRGGDYSDKADALRCSSRNGSDPRGWYLDLVGFRVIRSSHSSSS